MATGPEHYREAERLAQLAEGWLDADYGWKGQLRSEERLARRNSDLAAAHVHALLSLAAATALGNEGEGRTQPSKDRAAWFDVASECRKATA